jgi:hypothetical protein
MARCCQPIWQIPKMLPESEHDLVGKGHIGGTGILPVDHEMAVNMKLSQN